MSSTFPDWALGDLEAFTLSWNVVLSMPYEEASPPGQRMREVQLTARVSRQSPAGGCLGPSSPLSRQLNAAA